MRGSGSDAVWPTRGLSARASSVRCTTFIAASPSRPRSIAQKPIGAHDPSMRLVLVGWVVVLSFGCRRPIEGVDAGCTPVEAGPSCALPAYLSPADVSNWDEFFVTASALVCIGGLRDLEGGVLTESWCHPGFADLHVRRSHRGGLPEFPRREARACLERLATFVDPIGDGSRCLDLLRCAAPGECCPQRASEGEACGTSVDCLPWLVCDEGACRPRGACPDDPCPYEDEICSEGRCVRQHFSCDETCPEGAACRDGRCVPGAIGGLPCTCDADCAEGCIEGTCGGIGPIGCPCRSRLSCPTDVSDCVEGVCVARPMLGDACTPRGAACFGSACVEGVCARIPANQLGCANDSECAAGLECVRAGCRGLFDCFNACIEPTFEGGPCALGSICLDGRVCREGVCRTPALGDPCAPLSDCGLEATCVSGACAPLPTLGEPCDALSQCAAPLSCDAGRCIEWGVVGRPCDPTRGCSVANYCFGGRCAPRLTVGEPCSGDACIAGARCVGGLCRVIGALGEPCVDGSCVEDTYCEAATGRCAPSALPEETCGARPCVAGAECVDGVCYGPFCR